MPNRLVANSLLRALCLVLCAHFGESSVVYAKNPPRPKIFAIADVKIYVSDLRASGRFYNQISRDAYHICDIVQDPSRCSFSLPNLQGIVLEETPRQSSSELSSDLLAEVTFLTDRLDNMEKYLAAMGVPFDRQHRPTKGLWPGVFERLSVRDPEGNR